MYETELQKISSELKSKVIEYLESIEHNESYIIHFLQEADEKQNPEEYIKKKYPDIFE
jgi:hypothetical protein